MDYQRGLYALGVSLGLQNNCCALNTPPLWLGAFSCEVLSRAALERAPGVRGGWFLSVGLSHFSCFLESALAVVHGSALLIILGFPVNKYTYLKTSPMLCQIHNWDFHVVLWNLDLLLQLLSPRSYRKPLPSTQEALQGSFQQACLHLQLPPWSPGCTPVKSILMMGG